MSSGAPGMSTSNAVVRLCGVSKSYASSTGVAEVLDGVDFVLSAGEKASLIGPSGSGKSTLLSIIAGLVRPDSGTVEMGGDPLDKLDDAQRAERRARWIGIALQSDNLIPFLSARENVELAISFGGRRARRGQADGLLAQMGVADQRDNLPRQLSGGEAQRVAMAVALANSPALLLADEIAAQLDSATASRVVDAVFDADLAVLFVTHDIDLADRAATRWRLKDHRLVAR